MTIDEHALNGIAPAIQLLPLGDTAWTIEFGNRIDPTLHARVLGLAGALAQARKDGNNKDLSAIVDVVPTFRSLTVHYNPLACDGERLGEALALMAESSGAATQEGRQWLIPVCFDDEFAPDLNDLCEAKEMAREAVISVMTGACFQVYLIGFMPGFPYMGGLPAELEMPRLASPRKAVPARSLAIAGSMCSVYPWESPGGWRLLGRTPIRCSRSRKPIRRHCSLRATACAGRRSIDRPISRWKAPSKAGRSTGRVCSSGRRTSDARTS